MVPFDSERAHEETEHSELQCSEPVSERMPVYPVLPLSELVRQVRYFWGLDIMGEGSAFGRDGLARSLRERATIASQESDQTSYSGDVVPSSSIGREDREMGFGEPRKLSRTQAIKESVDRSRYADPHRWSGEEDQVIEREFYVDPNTGARKEVKEARFDLIPPDILLALAKHYGYGARKYGERNMEGGYKYSVSYAALQRHLNDWYMRQDYDEDPEGPGSSHLIAAIWHCITLFWFQLHDKGEDDRPFPPCRESSRK